MNRYLREMEIKVLKLVIKGHSNKDIAFLLNHSKRTVETHRTNNIKRYYVDNFTDLIKKSSLVGLR